MITFSSFSKLCRLFLRRSLLLDELQPRYGEPITNRSLIVSTISENQKVNAKDEVENEQAFSLAKEALSYISTFRTPPTPEIYEVWYRYVEGGNKAIQDQLSYAVHVAKSVSTCQLLSLRQQFLNTSDTAEANHQISLKLASEMEGLQSLVSTQQGAIVEFSDCIASANDQLIDETVSTAGMKSCLSLVLQGNDRMQQHIVDMDSKLQLSKSHLVSLRDDLAEMQKLILVDPLTGIGNRRLFDETILRANVLRTTATTNYLFLLDLDKFKTINDTHGHGTGDDVLRFVGNSLKKLAEGATIARYGGDEFAIFIAAEPEQAKALAEEICQFFNKNNMTVRKTGESLGKLTISLGAALLRVDDSSSSWFERADKLLYSAKTSGRNRVMVERKRMEQRGAGSLELNANVPTDNCIKT